MDGGDGQGLAGTLLGGGTRGLQEGTALVLHQVEERRPWGSQVLVEGAFQGTRDLQEGAFLGSCGLQEGAFLGSWGLERGPSLGSWGLQEGASLGSLVDGGGDDDGDVPAVQGRSLGRGPQEETAPEFP